MPVNCSSTDLDCLSRWNDRGYLTILPNQKDVPDTTTQLSSGTGSCPTKWPFDFLQPRKSLDGNRTCHWIDLIEATGGISSFYCQIKESLVYVQIQFSCMITDPTVGIE